MRLTGIDLFAGAGGASAGLQSAGVHVLAAVEIDEVASATYRSNFPDVELLCKDIRKIKVEMMRKKLNIERGELTILKACPPCQGFSTLSADRIDDGDERNGLVLSVTKFVREFLPKVVMLENVPAFEKDRRFKKFRREIEGIGYIVRTYVVNAKDFGVPQSRRRLICLGTRVHGGLPVSLPHSVVAGATVKKAFDDLSFEVVSDDPLMVPRKTSPLVRRRISAIPVGGNRFDLPPKLRLRCHRKLERHGSRSASGPYGRLKWDDVSPTMTTRCTSVSCGSFIHPSEDRSITLREAAALQTFPATYKFSGTYAEIERQIGNAVPPKLVKEVARILVA